MDRMRDMFQQSSDDELDRDYIIRKAIHVFNPISYMSDITKAVLYEDNLQLWRIEERRIENEKRVANGERRLPPIRVPPLSEDSKRVLNDLAALFAKWDTDMDNPNLNAATSLAAEILNKALAWRLQEESNEKIAENIHRWLGDRDEMGLTP